MDGATTLRDRVRVVERRELWLWACAVIITLLLTGGIVSFGFPTLHVYHAETNSAPLNDTILGLVGMVLLFDIYTVYQHFQINAVRQQLLEREELFRLITENAADMIAVVDIKRRAGLQQSLVRKDSGLQARRIETQHSSGSKFIRRIGRKFKKLRKTPGVPASARAWNIACATKMEAGARWNRAQAPS